MLPGIRSVLFAIIAAVALMIGAFALVATFRVAQESRSGSLQAEFAQRSRALVAANDEPRAIAPIEQPTPLEPVPVRPVEVTEAPEIPVPMAEAAPQGEPPAVELSAEAPAVEPPVEAPAAVATVPQTAPPATFGRTADGRTTARRAGRHSHDTATA